MPKPFLEVFPREIRDHIYAFILNPLSLSPWTIEVERSLSILRTCRQIHRECKDVIWAHNGLTIREETELFQRWAASSKLQDTAWPLDIQVELELLDRDELEWIKSALPALGKEDRTISLSAHSEKPESIKEFEQLLLLKEGDCKVDGRLYYEDDFSFYTKLKIDTIWPPFAHWGKHKWLRGMLLDSSNLDSLLKEMHDLVGGELRIDGRLCFKDHVQVDELKLDPRDGEIVFVVGPT